MRTFYFTLWFLLSSSSTFFLFLTYSKPSWIGCPPYFHTWCGLSENLKRRSEMCCTRLVENAGRKKSQKIAICAPSHNFVGLYLRIWGTYWQSENNLLNSNTSSTCSCNMVNFGPLTPDIGSGVCGTPANFNGFRVLASLLYRRGSTEVNQTLHDVWPSPWLVHCRYIFGRSYPVTEFYQVQNPHSVQVLRYPMN